MSSHLLARFTAAIDRHHASRHHPDDELDGNLRNRPPATEHEDDQQRRRRELRGVPVIGQDAGQPADERRDPLQEVLRRERASTRGRRAHRSAEAEAILRESRRNA